MRYFPALITRADGEIIDVEYDDLELVEENTSVSRVRVRRGPCAPHGWKEGQRGLVSGRDGFLYPGLILAADGQRLFVSMLDGRHAWALPEEIVPLRLQEGQAIEVRQGAGADYLPATAQEVKGDVLRVQYETGEEETTLVRLARVRRENLAS